MKRKHTKQPAAQVPAPQPRREVARLSPDPEQGLTLHQVKERQQNGWANDPVDSPTKTVGQIVRENVFTFFNFIFVVLAALALDALVGLVTAHLPGASLPFAYRFLLAPLVLCWYVVTELGSIAENAVTMGAPCPAFLQKALEVAQAGLEAAGDGAADAGKGE